MRKVFFLPWLAVLLTLNGGIFLAQAQEYTSSSFVLKNSTLTIQGGESSSSGFKYFSATGQTVTGENTSLNFMQRAGFLYFVTAASPSLSATVGDNRVILTWTASVSPLANIEYRVGIANASGGPYTYTSVGDVLTYTKTFLNNGQTYYFKVRVFAGDEFLAESGEISAVPFAPAVGPGGSGGGGGGGVGGGGPGGGGAPGASIPPQTGVHVSGRAYPLSTVKILKDGQVHATTIAGPDAIFDLSITSLTAGNYNFSVLGVDNQDRISQAFNFAVMLTAGTTTSISGIFIAPTIAVNKKIVKQGDNIAIFGQSAPKGLITIAINSAQTYFRRTQADKEGVYLYNFDTVPLEIGEHETKSKAQLKKEISDFGKAVSFRVAGEGEIPPPTPTKTACATGDLNCDGKVNLIDFSIAAFWYQKPLSAEFKFIELERLNGDSKVDLVDFSIMAYHWTG